MRFSAPRIKSVAAGLILLLSCTWANAQVDVLIAYDGVNGCMDAPDAELLATGKFNSVSTFDISLGTPLLSDLTGYDSVMVTTNCEPLNPVGVGDVLADYVDAGGNVVMTTYATSDPWSVEGRIMATGYAPLPTTANLTCVTEPLVILQPSDPIFDGVNLAAMTIDHNCNMADSVLDTGALLIAQDSAGVNMIARNASGNVTVINVWSSPSGNNNAEYWLLLANALQGDFVPAPPPTPYEYVPVPTLSFWGLLALAAIMLVVGAPRLRRNVNKP